MIAFQVQLLDRLLIQTLWQRNLILFNHARVSRTDTIYEAQRVTDFLAIPFRRGVEVSLRHRSGRLHISHLGYRLVIFHFTVSGRKLIFDIDIGVRILACFRAWSDHDFWDYFHRCAVFYWLFDLVIHLFTSFLPLVKIGFVFWMARFNSWRFRFKEI